MAANRYRIGALKTEDLKSHVPSPLGPVGLADGADARALVEEAARRLRLVEPRAYLVEARVLRRVIRAEADLPALALHIPHRKTWLVKRNTLIRHVEPDELGIEPFQELPDRAILIQRPYDQAVVERGLESLLLRCWR